MTVESVSEELIEAMEPTRKEIEAMAKRKKALRNCRYVTTDGDVLTRREYEKELAYLDAMLRREIEKNGALHVEGVGTFRLQDRMEVVRDLMAIQRDDPTTFNRLMELACLNVNEKTLEAQMKAKQIGDPGHAMKMLRSRALVLEDE